MTAFSRRLDSHSSIAACPTMPFTLHAHACSLKTRTSQKFLNKEQIIPGYIRIL